MPRYDTSIHTPADPASAFAYISRFDRAVEWDPGVAEGTMLGDGPVGLGSRFRIVARFCGRSLPLEYEVVDFLSPERIVLRAEAGGFRSTDTITLTADGPGSIVHYEAELAPKGWARLASPLFSVVFRRIGDRAAAGLRRRMSALPAR